MWPISTAAQEVLRGSQAVAVRGTAFGPNGQAYVGLPISGGTVTDDSTSQTRRTATLYVADTSLWPANPLDVLSPLGAELQIDYGIAIPGAGIEWIPLIRGLLTVDDEAIPTQGQGITVTLADRSQRIKDDRLAAPLQIGGSGTVVSQIKTLILGTLPNATILDLTGDTTACPLLTIQQDKWADGIEPLALSIGAEVFCDPVGRFVIRYQPTLASNPVWLVDTGPRGILVSDDRVRSRDAVYNQVTASGESSTGAAPVSATVTNIDPTSPTFFGGPFGRKPRFVTSAAYATIAQCTAAATAVLARAEGMDTTHSLETVCNPALQSGDCMALRGDTGNQRMIADSLTFPLDFNSPQGIMSRGTVLPDE